MRCYRFGPYLRRGTRGKAGAKMSSDHDLVQHFFTCQVPGTVCVSPLAELSCCAPLTSLGASCARCSVLFRFVFCLWTIRLCLCTSSCRTRPRVARVIYTMIVEEERDMYYTTTEIRPHTEAAYLIVKGSNTYEAIRYIGVKGAAT